MNKKLTVIAVVIILAAGTLAFWKIWTAKVAQEKKLSSPVSQNQAKGNLPAEKKITRPADPMENELEEMEAALNLVDNEDLGETELSDEKVGL